MTAVFTPVTREPIGQVLTAEQYDALPENELRELVDGVIRIMASPTMGRATGPLEVKLRPNRRRNPDVVVVPASEYDRRAPGSSRARCCSRSRWSPPARRPTTGARPDDPHVPAGSVAVPVDGLVRRRYDLID